MTEKKARKRANPQDYMPEAKEVARAAIAAHLATTSETVSRILRTMEEAAAIRFNRHRIIIVDEDLLGDFAVE